MLQYHRLLQAIRRNGVAHEDRTEVGTQSLFGAQLIHGMQEGFPLLTTKKIPFRWVAEELFWILRGSTDEHELRAKGVDIWKEWADEKHTSPFGREPGDLGPVYGWQLRHFGADYIPLHFRMGQPLATRGLGHDQLWHLCHDLQTNPFSRRHVVSMWNPAQVSLVTLPPCHTLYQCKVEAVEGQERPNLSLELYARSIDSFLGLPFNIASYGLLLCLLAHICDYGRGDLIISFGDVHIYRNHAAQVEEQLSRTLRPLPQLNISERLKGRPGASSFNLLTGIRYEDLELTGYDPWPSIAAEVAV